MIFRIVVIALALAGAVDAQEKKIQRINLPPAVEQTVAIQSQGATVKGFSEENENGQKYYEAELMVDGHSKDILIDHNGDIVEVEEQVDFDSLPSVVKDGLRSKAAKGKILKVESLTKHNKVVAYEAKILINSKKSEIQVGPDGKPLDHEE